MSDLPAFALHAVYYLPGAESVTVVVRARDGPFAGALRDLYTTQTELGAAWGDAEVRTEAATLLAALGGQLADA